MERGKDPRFSLWGATVVGWTLLNGISARPFLFRRAFFWRVTCVKSLGKCATPGFFARKGCRHPQQIFAIPGRHAPNYCGWGAFLGSRIFPDVAGVGIVISVPLSCRVCALWLLWASSSFWLIWSIRSIWLSLSDLCALEELGDLATLKDLKALGGFGGFGRLAGLIQWRRRRYGIWTIWARGWIWGICWVWLISAIWRR